MSKNHKVELDVAGWGGYSRFTCHTCQATLVKQPWMNENIWQQKVQDFLTKHPEENSK